MNPQDNEQIQLLREILKWIKIAGIGEVKEALTSELDTDQKKLVYQLSDGSKTLAEINVATGVSTGAISRYWKKWANQGLGERTSVRGGERFTRAFDLEDFGISVPEIDLCEDIGEVAKEEPKEQPEASK
jgi:hypothetical protein